LTASGSGETIVGIADSPQSGRSRRALLLGAGLVGAAAVGLAWLFVGNDGNSGVSSSLASLGQAPGIAPPDYAYLDSARVALYLGQLEGGIATSEQLTQQLTQGRNAGLSAGGLSLGGSTGSSSSAERVVTPTATGRFYQLLDLLGRDGYLHTVNEAGTPAEIRRAFSGIPEGSFVKLTGCTLRLPSYIRLEQISRASHGLDSFAMLFTAEQGGPTTGAGSGQVKLANGRTDTVPSQVMTALIHAGRVRAASTTGLATVAGPAVQQLGRAIKTLDKTVGADPRVPLSSCDGTIDYQPRGVDLLFPIRLANLSSEESLIAGPVTLVGKLVRAVRNPGQEYVDDASFSTFAEPTLTIADVAESDSPTTLYDELNSDAVVLAPGAVILPIAIYK
jgi:hypothetical protein